MLPKRAEDSGEYPRLNQAEIAHAEAARSAAESSRDAESGEKNISLFWRVFGGTILSMVALGAITLYNNISSNIAELRSELNRERDARADLVRKDEFNNRTTSQYDRMRTFETLRVDFEGLKERINANHAAFESLKRDVIAMADGSKKDATSLEVLKERIASLESLKKDLSGIELLREKLAFASTELKQARDDITKIQKDLDRNAAADLERKLNRDTQHKQFEDTLKELQKGLQDCREKIVRLEGMRPQPKSSETGKTAPGGD